MGENKIHCVVSNELLYEEKKITKETSLDVLLIVILKWSRSFGVGEGRIRPVKRGLRNFEVVVRPKSVSFSFQFPPKSGAI